jgi:hypothetical protein
MSDEIRAALQKLDPKNDAHWTEDGLPAIAALGFKKAPSRAEITNAAPKFTRVTLDISAAAAERPATETADGAQPQPMLAKDEEEELAMLQLEVDAAQVEMDKAYAVQASAQKALAAAQDKHGALLRKLDATAHKRRGLDNIEGIQRVLQGHIAERAKAGELAAQLRSTGITPAMFSGKAAIDAAMARKNARGGQRPQFNPR